MSKKLKIGLAMLLALCTVFSLACFQDIVSDETHVTETAVPVDADNISFITPAPDAHREELEAILRRSTMLEGVTVNGVKVGGMTLAEAKDAVRAELQKDMKNYTVNLVLGEDTVPFTGEIIPVTDNLDAVLDEAFNIVRENKGFDAVSREVEEIKVNGRDFPVAVHFEEASLKGAVEVFAKEHDVAPTNASVAYDKDTNAVKFTDDIPGKSVDGEALLAALLLANNGDTVEVPTVETAAEITTENVKDKFVLRGKMTTNYSKSIKNRKYNIKKGADMISGIILHPGDVFSANGTLGVRNKANGWKTATAYEAGAHVKQYGGGVCQLSSTLYNAAVKADMKIVERRNHSMYVDYVPHGLDATINSTDNIIDFKFQNSSKSDVIIIAYADGNYLTMEIWGIPIIEDSDGKYDEIRIPDTKKLKTLKPSGEVEYIVDESKKPGYKETVAKKRDGSVWQSYVEYYLNGQLVERKELDQSTYKAYAGVYIVGPDATPKPDSTSKPDKTPKPSDSDDPDPTSASDPDPTKPADTPKPTPDPTPKPTDSPSGGDE